MIGLIIQARSGSTRFKRKIYTELNGKTTLYRVLHSALINEMPHRIILAMPEYDKVEFTNRLCNGEFNGAVDGRFRTYFGDPEDLVARYYGAAKEYGIDLVVRLTADCPFGGTMVDEMLIDYQKHGYNGFMGNNELVSELPYPDGTDVEIFPYWMLVEAMQLTNNHPVHREHVTPFMYRRGTEYPIHQFLNKRPNKMVNMKFNDFSFDTEDDRKLLEKITRAYDVVARIEKGLSQAELLNKALKVVESCESKGV